MRRLLLLLLLSGCANLVQQEDAGMDASAPIADADVADADTVADADVEPRDASAKDAEPLDGALARRLILPTSGSGVASSPGYRMKVSIGITPSGVASGSGRRVRLGATD